MTINHFHVMLLRKWLFLAIDKFDGCGYIAILSSQRQSLSLVGWVADPQSSYTMSLREPFCRAKPIVVVK